MTSRALYCPSEEGHIHPLGAGGGGRDLLIERTHEGLDHARAEGRIGGRPRKLTPAQVEAIRVSREAGTSVTELAAMHKVSLWTVCRALAAGVA